MGERKDRSGQTLALSLAGPQARAAALQKNGHGPETAGLQVLRMPSTS